MLFAIGLQAITVFFVTLIYYAHYNIIWILGLCKDINQRLATSVTIYVVDYWKNVLETRSEVVEKKHGLGLFVPRKLGMETKILPSPSKMGGTGAWFPVLPASLSITSAQSFPLNTLPAMVNSFVRCLLDDSFALASGGSLHIYSYGCKYRTGRTFTTVRVQ